MLLLSTSCVFLGLAALCTGNVPVGLINTVKVYEHSLTFVVTLVFVNNICWVLLWVMFLESVM